MLIAWLEPPSIARQGDQIHRSQAPARQLSKRPGQSVLLGSWLSPTMQEAAEQADGLVLCQAFDVDFVGLLERRRRAGRWTVVEINDHIYNERAIGQAGGFYQNPENRALIEQLAAEADALWVSSAPLLRQHRRGGQPCQIVPNAAPAAAPLRLPPPASAPFRIGWAGSLGHADDVAGIVPQLATVLAARPHARFAAMAPRALWPAFAALPADRVELHPPADFGQYLAFVRSLDVLVAPLLDTPFNRARSDGKFLEAAAMGTPFVGQADTVFDDAAGGGRRARLFSSPEALTSQLIELIDAPALGRALAAAARAWVESARSLSATCAVRQQTIDALAAGRGRSARQPAEAFQALLARAGREVGPALKATDRFGRVPIAGVGRDLFAALLDANEAEAWLARARAAAPSFYLVPLYQAVLALSGDAAIERLQEALRRMPTSDAAALALARALAGAGRSREANRLARATGARNSRWGPLWVESSRVALRAGNVGEAERALETALRVTPNTPGARAALCRLLVHPTRRTPARLQRALAVARAGGQNASNQACTGEGAGLSC